jgi:hypothetical protein
MKAKGKRIANGAMKWIKAHWDELQFYTLESYMRDGADLDDVSRYAVLLCVQHAPPCAVAGRRQPALPHRGRLPVLGCAEVQGHHLRHEPGLRPLHRWHPLLLLRPRRVPRVQVLSAPLWMACRVRFKTALSGWLQKAAHLRHPPVVWSW